MGRTVTVSEDLYVRLEQAARRRGLTGIEQLLEDWEAREQERCRRSQVVEQINALRAQLFATYGEMPDSAALIREDRER